MEIFYIFIFVTAVVFTIFGYSLGKIQADVRVINLAISTTIDNLVREGYLKTRGTGDNMEILKVNDDKTN